MKLQVSNTNEPVWRNLTVSAELPKELKPLEELSKNLWWVWNSEAKNLFRDLDHDLWRKVGENPVMLLQQISSDRLKEVLSDERMMERVNGVYAEYFTGACPARAAFAVKGLPKGALVEIEAIAACG